MNEQIRNNAKPRKILGSNGSSTVGGHHQPFTTAATNPSLNISYQHPNSLPPSYTINESGSIYSNLTFCNNSLNPLTLQSSQQMDRLRFPLISQEMHPLWPYGATTILSPLMPANLALPYTLPYTAVPIYQNGPQCATSSPVSNVSSASSNGSQTNHTQPPSTATTNGCASGINCSTNTQNTSNDSNKINIQIQCVSQNAPVNFNSMHDSLAKVNFGNFCHTSCQMGEKDNNKEINPSLRSSPIPLTLNDNAAGGDASNFNYNGTNSDLTNGSAAATGFLSQARFNELTRLALRGSDIAENLAKTHHNRPCFKKIDSLCARLKQDLIRPDGVLPNINSQGIAWAVKDFIFVFTRIINAWIIIKGYVYNTPEGLNKVKAALSPDFVVSFAAWQDTTMVFIESLIKSFVNLDNLVQSQKNVYQKSDTSSTQRNNNSPIKLLPTINNLLEDSLEFLNTTCEKTKQNSLNKNYIYTMVEDSESQQRQATVNGTYFKTGTYNPIKKDGNLTEHLPIAGAAGAITACTDTSIAAMDIASRQMLTAPIGQYLDGQLSGYCTAAVTSAEYSKPRENLSTDWLNYDLTLLDQNTTKSYHNSNHIPTQPKYLEKDHIENINVMIERLMCMKNADMFFKIQFTKNYFPDFITKHERDFMDIRSIILKNQIGGYQNIFELVHDVKKIVHFGKEFLKEMHHHHPHNTTTTTGSSTATAAAVTAISSSSSTLQQTTQPPTQRRRKKRPNYGTRCVEVRRGYSGFGFTISGQQPCRLSCIIPNSPADQAGLRAGDFLISVNGLNVSKLPHETVVQLIGNSFGSIRMQIAEHYYSDSTDEENAVTGIPTLPIGSGPLGPSRPRYIYHKSKQQRLRHLPQKKSVDHSVITPMSRATAASTTSSKKSGQTQQPVLKPISMEIAKAVASVKRPFNEKLKSTDTISPTAFYSKQQQHTQQQHAAILAANVRAMVRGPSSAALEYRAVVGYLGTIEMPKQIANSSKLQTVRSCIRKLRQEKRQPSMVLMIILPDCLKLQANNGKILATYPSPRLNYVSSSSESENRFFGLVTSTVYSPLDECEDDDDDDETDEQDKHATNDEDEALRASATTDSVNPSSNTDANVIISNSCHVFVVDTKLCEHQQHLAKAQEFCIECTKDPISNLCLEFPNNSEYVVNLIRSMYTMRIMPPITHRSISDDPALHCGGRNNGTAHSPQPSNHSEISTTTSNSDSGIGYNNDCSNVTDRIVLVDFSSHNLGIRSAGGVVNAQRPQNICQQSLHHEDLPTTSKRLPARLLPETKVSYSAHGRSLMVSRSCDDVLNLIEQETEDSNGLETLGLAAVPLQQCYASMDDISLHTTSMENGEGNKIHPELLKPDDKIINVDSVDGIVDEKEILAQHSDSEKRRSLKITLEAWNSLQNINAQSAEVMDTTTNKLASTPDLSRPDLSGNDSPFERGWIQTSLRTPRADKHTMHLSTGQQDDSQHQLQLKSPNISRSASMSNSERSSFKKKTLLGEKSKVMKKGPTAWGTSIEILLADPAGLKTFAEFLKLEYAAENIYFWTACERFRCIETELERQTEALHIYQKHLSNGSLEPVNVDSQARSLVERNLNKAAPDLFHPAQKQIFNLMKFDSYQRFLRSDLYKQCLQAEKKGKSLPFTGENLDDLLKTTNFLESASLKLKKSASNAEEGRPRRSLLPWHRKTRSKSRDQIAQETVKDPPPPPSKIQVTVGSSGCYSKGNAIHGSASSLTSFDALTFGNNITANDMNYSLCRIKFPDGATTMVQLKTQETVAELVDRLMEKRSIRYQFFDVSIKGPPSKSVDLKSLAKDLAGKEVEIEQRVAFKLDLPTPKVISVKSKPRKQLYEVVRPILQRYHINPEIVEVLMRETQTKVDLTQLVTAVNDQRLQVVYKRTCPSTAAATTVLHEVSSSSSHHRKAPGIPKNSVANGIQSAQTTLDEITNKVFSDLMQVKQNQEELIKPSKFDQCSLKSDECPSETSSFFKIRRAKRDSINNVSGAIRCNKTKKISPQPHLLSPTTDSKNKTKTGIKLQLPVKVIEKQDDLLEDLKRAQLARLEDQRGTEINFELPEFLKNTDNVNKPKTTEGSSVPESSDPVSGVCENVSQCENVTTVSERPPQPAPRHSITNKTKSANTTSPMKVDDDNLVHDQKSLTEDSFDFTTPSKGPPPLPPKPKVLPIKPSNWGVNMSAQLNNNNNNKMSPTTSLPPITPTIASPQLTNANVVAVPASNNSSPNARCAYLDQPSSSFV